MNEGLQGRWVDLVVCLRCGVGPTPVYPVRRETRKKERERKSREGERPISWMRYGTYKELEVQSAEWRGRSSKSLR